MEFQSQDGASSWPVQFFLDALRLRDDARGGRGDAARVGRNAGDFEVADIGCRSNALRDQSTELRAQARVGGVEPLFLIVESLRILAVDVIRQLSGAGRTRTGTDLCLARGDRGQRRHASTRGEADGTGKYEQG